MEKYPRITVITPSLNQGKFIEQTILSVLGQQYSNLEFFIVDGESTDQTLNIIKKYEDKITWWVSEKDSGQAEAINKGFDKSTGDILCWLNSDDMFMPGTLHYIAEIMGIHNPIIISGSCIRFKETTEGIITSGHTIIEDSMRFSLKDNDFIMQPSTFWTRQAWEKVGKLNEELHYVFDWDWFMRATFRDISFKYVNRTLSLYRIHENHKTSIGKNSRIMEILRFYSFYEPINVKIFNYLLENKPILDKLVIKFLGKTIKLFYKDSTNIILLKFIFPKLRKIEKVKLEAIYRML